jgi:hypothetical protein
MTQALEGAVDAIVAVLRSVSGLKQVPINPPENISVDTFAIVYPFSGSVEISPIGTRRMLHVIAVDILTRRTDLARNIAALKPLVDTVSNALMTEVSSSGDVFSGTMDTFGSLSYSWITSDYGGVGVVGYHFLMNDVKILVNL